MPCREFEPFFSQYIDGELEREQYEALRFHLNGCPRCSTILDEMRQAVIAVRSLTRVAPRSAFKDTLRLRLRQEMTRDLYQRPVWTQWADSIAELSRLGLQRAVQVGVVVSLLVMVGIGAQLIQSRLSPTPVSQTLETRRSSPSTDRLSAGMDRPVFSQRARPMSASQGVTPRQRPPADPLHHDITAPFDELLSTQDHDEFSQYAGSSEFQWIMPTAPENGVIIAETSPAADRLLQPLPLRSLGQSGRLMDLTGSALTGKRDQWPEPGESFIDGRDERMHYLLPTIPSRRSFARVAF